MSDFGLKFCCDSLEGDVQKWFDRLSASSINGYDNFVTKLNSDWSHKLDGKFLLHQLFDIKKRENETVHEFNLRFDKIVGNTQMKLDQTTKQLLSII